MSLSIPYPFQSSSKTACAVVQFREDIIQEWSSKVLATVPVASELSEPVLINTIPILLERLAEALSPEHPRSEATEESTVATEHGSERARLTKFGPDQLIREYQCLRDSLFMVLETKVQLSKEDQFIILESIDRSMQDAMTSYFLVHQRIREQFTATLSHDLRNPIGTMKMAAELILETADQLPKDESQEELKDLSSRILKNAQRADRMIQDLLDASSLQIGQKLLPNLSECQLVDIFEELKKELTESDRSRLVLSIDPVQGHWDRENLKRAFENLINNAFKYGRRDTPVTVTAKEHHQRVTISVHNSGPPIPMEDRETLFQAFRRSYNAKSSGKKGWGLGLALVRGVAEAHGGSIEVESLVDSGTTFVIDLPLDARPFQSAPTVDLP